MILCGTLLAVCEPLGLKLNPHFAPRQVQIPWRKRLRTVPVHQAPDPPS
jgi:hypothetical protein